MSVMRAAGLMFCIGLVTVAGSARAGPPVAVYDLNFADYGGFTYEIPENALPPGYYRVTLSSDAAVTQFMLETGETFSEESFYPDGVYMGGDEEYENSLAFSFDPTTEGHPYTDVETVVVPPTTVYNQYYPDGVLENTTTVTVDQELITVLSHDPTGSAVVTVSVLPEPEGWLMLIAGAALAGAALRRRRAIAATA